MDKELRAFILLLAMGLFLFVYYSKRKEVLMNKSQTRDLHVVLEKPLTIKGSIGEKYNLIFSGIFILSMVLHVLVMKVIFNNMDDKYFSDNSLIPLLFWFAVSFLYGKSISSINKAGRRKSKQKNFMYLVIATIVLTGVDYLIFDHLYDGSLIDYLFEYFQQS